MRKFSKKAFALALAGVMTLGMSVNAFAAETTANTKLNESTSPSDTAKIKLYKDYVIGSANQKNTTSPEETFSFAIAKYGAWNVGENGAGVATYDKDSMPTFTTLATITAAAGEAEANTKSSVELTVPRYTAVGDYWYKVTETDNNVAGVIYGTNDGETEDLTAANGAHDQVYFIHVQVINGDMKGQYIRSVTLHQTAPGTNVTTNAQYEAWYASNGSQTTESGKKVTDIQNKYFAGSLKVAKTVTGNAGDKNEMFKVTVVFTNNSGGAMNSDIVYKDFYASNTAANATTSATSIEWTEDPTKTVEFWVKDGTTVTFDNIPYGVSYVITETQPSDDKYTHTFAYENDTADEEITFNGISNVADTVTAEGETWNNANATGSIANDLDEVRITNEKQSIIDIGVATTNAPYIAMLAVAACALALFIRHKKYSIED